VTTYLINTETKKTIELLDQTFLAEDQRLAIPIWDSTPDAQFHITEAVFLIETAGNEESGIKGSLKQLLYVEKTDKE
jgi:hypothetical protein